MKEIIIAIAIIFNLSLNAQIINTIAGNGTRAYSGDGAPATAAEFNYPAGIAIDAVGNIYIADQNNNRIRKITTLGIISTIAGNGSVGYSGDGGAAIAAKLHSPTGLALDAVGNLYIADFFNNRIRKINTAGIITTIAGNGNFGYSGDGAAATTAELKYPNGIALDAVGNIYIADNNSNRIRLVNTAGIISTIAGNGTAGYSGDGALASSAQLNFPTAVTVDAVGNLYIADGFNNRIRSVNTAGIISTIAGNGTAGYSGDGAPAIAAQFNNPMGLAIDAGGNLYIADQYNHCIRMVNTTGIISTVAGNGTQGFSGDGSMATLAQLNNPFSVIIDAANIMYIGDQFNQRIRISAPCVTPTITVNSVTVCAGNTATLTANGAATYSWSTGETVASIMVTPTITTSYTLAVATGTCTNSAETIVTVNNPTTATINPVACNSLTINAITYTATGTYSQNLSNAQGCDSTLTIQAVIKTPTTATISPVACNSVTINAITYTATGTYTQNLSNAQGCDSMLTIKTTINPLPTLTIIASSATICAGSTVTLTVNGANTYTWNTNETTTSIIVSPTVTSTYTIMGVDASGCENITTFTQTVTNCGTTSVTQYDATNNLQVYPNPFVNELTITSTAKINALLFGILGNKINEFVLQNGTQTITLNDLEPGIYYLQVDTIKVKIIKQ